MCTLCGARRLAPRVRADMGVPRSTLTTGSPASRKNGKVTTIIETRIVNERTRLCPRNTRHTHSSGLALQRRDGKKLTLEEHHESGRPSPEKSPRCFRARRAELLGGDRVKREHRRGKGQDQPRREVEDAARETPGVEGRERNLNQPPQPKKQKIDSSTHKRSVFDQFVQEKKRKKKRSWYMINTPTGKKTFKNGCTVC